MTSDVNKLDALNNLHQDTYDDETRNEHVVKASARNVPGCVKTQYHSWSCKSNHISSSISSRKRCVVETQMGLETSGHMWSLKVVCRSVCHQGGNCWGTTAVVSLQLSLYSCRLPFYKPAGTACTYSAPLPFCVSDQSHPRAVRSCCFSLCFSL